MTNKTLPPTRAPIWITLGLLLILAAGLRLATFDRFLPLLDYSDESNMFLLALDMRPDPPPIAEDYGAPLTGEWLAGYPPLFPWLSIASQQALEAASDQFLFPGAYIGALRWLSVFANILTVPILFWVGYTLLAGTGPGWSTAGGALAALPYAISPVIVDVGNLAIPDSLIPLACGLALLGAARAITQDAPLWLVWSLLGAVAAIYLKYSVMVGLWATFCGVVVLVRRRGWRQMLPWLAGLAAISALTGGYLIFGYGALGLENQEAEGFRESGLANMLSLHRNGLNLLTALQISTGVWPFVVVLAAGAVPLVRRWGSWLWLLVPFVIGNIMLTSSVTYVSEALGGYGRVRYVFPAVLALSVIWALAAVGVARWLVGWRRWAAPAALVALALAVVLPVAPANAAQITRYAATNTRLALWRYTDANLPNDGKILTPRFSKTHVTWNRPYSGYTGKTFEWEHNDRPYELDPAQLLADGIHYVVFTEPDRQEQLDVPAMDTWVEELFRLKTITPDGESLTGEQTYIYRTAPPEVVTDVMFGERIRLVGYDLNTTQAAPGDVLRFRPYWQATATPAANYSMSVQLLSVDGTAIAQVDGPPASAARLPLTWDDPEERLIGALAALEVPPETPPGEYTLAVVLYNFETGARLPVAGGDAYPIEFTVAGDR